RKNGKKTQTSSEAVEKEELVVTASGTSTDADEEKDLPVVARRKKKDKKGKRSGRALLLLISFLFSILLWMYIQITTNPVTEKSFTLQIQFENAQLLKEKNLAATYPYQSVTVRIVGRKNDMDKLSSSDLSAYLDLSGVEETGSVRLPVNVKCDENVYFRVELQRPEDIAVSIYTLDSET
ncbi:MAG: hypothetical protein IKX04_08430, partial [Clostridiales bacterium]|nr:hypothetical protein [Clostridiales bacterium]